jgi:hypothetical protein
MTELVATMTALFLFQFVATADLSIVATATPAISSPFHTVPDHTWIGSICL